ATRVEARSRRAGTPVADRAAAGPVTGRATGHPMAARARGHPTAGTSREVCDSARRMAVENVDSTTPDGVADAYLARPDEQPHPGVLFIMDAFGLRPTIAEMSERIAADGYVVLAPNVFYRGGRSPVLPMPDLSDPGERDGF